MYYIEVEPNVKLLINDINPSGIKTIVFIHGWPLENRMFEYQYNILPVYGYRCIGIDLRGFGGSDKPWGDYSYEHMADDIRVIIEKLNLNNIILVGFSMGGAIAIKYMSKYNNDRVSKLALLSAAAPSFTRYQGYPYGKTKEEVNSLILQAYKDRPQLLTDFNGIFFNNPPTPSFINWFNSLGLSASGNATIKTLELLRDENVLNDLRNINVPTGIFFGANDKVCSPEFAAIMHNSIPKSQLFRFDRSGHAVFYDELEKFNMVFFQFLNN